jgi:hypothetical protein
MPLYCESFFFLALRQAYRHRTIAKEFFTASNIMHKSCVSAMEFMHIQMLGLIPSPSPALQVYDDRLQRAGTCRALSGSEAGPVFALADGAGYL